MLVALAVLSLRVRGKGERHVSVRAEFNGDGVALKISGRRLDPIIASAKN